MAIRVVTGGAEGVRVAAVDDHGNETPITDICRIEVVMVPDDIPRVFVHTFLATGTDVLGGGAVVTLCPDCKTEVSRVDHA